MNPFKNLTPIEGLADNPASPYYDRYRIDANQVYPFREPLCNNLILRLVDIESALLIYDCLSERIQRLFHIHKSVEANEAQFQHLDFLKTDEYFLEFYMGSDAIQIGIENIYFTFLEFAAVLENCHFFIYSTGDGDDRWLDEYKVKNREIFFTRNICESHILAGRLNFYIEKAIANPTDSVFIQFTLYQLYSRLHFWLKNSIDEYSTIEKLNQKYPDKIFALDDPTTYTNYYFHNLYELDKECDSLHALNAKYHFDKKIYNFF